MMMIAVKGVDELLRPWAFCNHVKHITVHQVFEEGPEKPSGQENQGYADNRVVQPGPAVIKRITDNRQVHSPDHKRVGLGQHFKILVLKQLRLSFIMYLFEFHDS